jgi:hypothetical protein
MTKLSTVCLLFRKSRISWYQQLLAMSSYEKPACHIGNCAPLTAAFKQAASL